MLGTLSRDITEHKKAEEKLRESEAFNSNLLSNAPNPIIVINPDSSIKYVNPALEKLTGFTSAELIGMKKPYPWRPPENTRGAFPSGTSDSEMSISEFNCRKEVSGLPSGFPLNTNRLKRTGKSNIFWESGWILPSANRLKKR